MITLDGRSFTVAGIAVTAALPPYPNVSLAMNGGPFDNPGVIWLTQADARSLATHALPLSYFLNLKQADPAMAEAFRKRAQHRQHGRTRSLLGIVLGTLLAVAALTAIPARIGARRPVAEILQSELA